MLYLGCIMAGVLIGWVACAVMTVSSLHARQEEAQEADRG